MTSEDSDPSSSATAASVTGDETGGEISNNQGRNIPSIYKVFFYAKDKDNFGVFMGIIQMNFDKGS